MCDLKPESCLELGAALVEGKRDDEAASVYKQAFPRLRDRVAASHHAGWLVGYEFRKGRPEQALAIAKEAADTYSGSGLATYAWILEKLERFDEAQRYLVALKDRYDDPELLGDFAIRSVFARHDERLRAEADARVKELFPGGMRRVALAEMTSPPVAGVLVKTETPEALRIGINEGDVIVALDGYRVTSFEQYRTVRWLKTEPRIELIVWKKGRYVEIAAELPDRTFKSELGSWSAGSMVDRER
jgi:hypothetical protein